MSSWLTDYCAQLEAAAARRRRDDAYLWPWTPRGADLQREIRERVGAGDRDVAHRRSRSGRIIRQLHRLIERGLLSPDFVALDVMCGDALVLAEIQTAFPRAQCTGIDCDEGRFATHLEARRRGVQICRAYVQDVFATDPPAAFDVVLMLNTYRDWDSAALRSHERNLPRLADAWLRRNARYMLLTVRPSQMPLIRQNGFRIAPLGRGEDDSELICAGQTMPLDRRQQMRATAHAAGLDGRVAFRLTRAFREGGVAGVARAVARGVRRFLGSNQSPRAGETL